MSSSLSKQEIIEQVKQYRLAVPGSGLAEAAHAVLNLGWRLPSELWRTTPAEAVSPTGAIDDAIEINGVKMKKEDFILLDTVDEEVFLKTYQVPKPTVEDL